MATENLFTKKSHALVIPE